MPRFALAAAVLALLALGMASCGGGGGSGSTAVSTATMPTATTVNPAAPKPADRQKQAKSGGGGGADTSRGPKVVPAPLNVSGGGSAQFKVKGGDNSIQEYGSESGESELREAAEAVHSFYVARVAGEWAKACSYLAKSTAAGLEQLAAQSPQLKGKGCVAGLDAMTKPVSGSLQRQLTALDAAALRHEGQQAFLIYTGPPGKTVYTMPMKQEDGEWKVDALSGDALPGAGAP